MNKYILLIVAAYIFFVYVLVFSNEKVEILINDQEYFVLLGYDKTVSRNKAGIVLIR